MHPTNKTMAFIIPHKTSTQITIKTYCAEIDDNAVDLNPEFQRNYIYKLQQKQALIEYIVTFGDVPGGMYFHTHTNNEGRQIFESIDGKQRSLTIYTFRQDEFRFSSDKKYFDDINNKVFSAWPSARQHAFNQLNITRHIFVDELSNETISEFFIMLQKSITTLLGERINAIRFACPIGKELTKKWDNRKADPAISYITSRTDDYRFHAFEMILKCAYVFYMDEIDNPVISNQSWEQDDILNFLMNEDAHYFNDAYEYIEMTCEFMRTIESKTTNHIMAATSFIPFFMMFSRNTDPDTIAIITNKIMNTSGKFEIPADKKKSGSFQRSYTYIIEVLGKPPAPVTTPKKESGWFVKIRQVV